MARPSLKPTAEHRALVVALIGSGLTHEAVRRALELQSGRRMPASTFYRHFRTEISNGKDALEAMLVGSLVRAAQRGSVAACAFLLKARFGWRETAEVEITGSIQHQQPGVDDAVAAVRQILDEAAAAKAAGAQQGDAEQPDRVH